MASFGAAVPGGGAQWSVRQTPFGLAINIPGFNKLEDRLKNPIGLLKKIGALMIAEAQSAFKEQRLGDFIWPARYPSQAPPKVNIAGIVADFAKGTWNPPARRFQDRPAGIDRGDLRNSLTAQSAVKVLGKYTVEAGSTVPEASRTQWGGSSIQQITKTVLDSLARYMKYLRRASKKDSFKGVLGKAKLHTVESKLGFLFQVKALETEVAQRPFLGITDRLEKKVVNVVKDFFEGK